MIFEANDREDGNFELVLDAKGIEYLEQGLTELRYMDSGQEAITPSITSEGVGDFVLRRAADEG